MEKSEIIEKKKLDKRLIVLFIVAIVALLVAIGTYLSTPITKTKKREIISTSPQESFVFETIKGEKFKIDASPQSFKISNMKNKIVFLKIFSWNCKYCKKEIPELINLKKQFDGAFDIIAIESESYTTKENLQFAKERDINYHIVTGDKYKKFFQYLKEHHGWSGVIPLSIVLGENGDILAFEVGAKSYTLAELLKVSLQQYKIIQNLNK